MTADRLLLPDDVRETLHERRAAGAPAEVCGVLLGRRGDSAGERGGASGEDGDTTGERRDPTGGDEDPTADRVAEAVAVENVASAPERFYELDPAETVAVIEAAEARGLEPVGFYHSHPRGPAAPSATDRQRATWTGYVYCIVAPDNILAVRWTGEAFRPLAVETP